MKHTYETICNAKYDVKRDYNDVVVDDDLYAVLSMHE